MEILIAGKPPDVLEDNYTVATNEDWFRDYQLKHSGSPIRIEAGWKFFMQLQRLDTERLTSGDLAMTISSDNGRLVVTDRDAGKFGLRVRQADAAQVTSGQYKYDIV